MDGNAAEGGSSGVLWRWRSSNDSPCRGEGGGVPLSVGVRHLDGVGASTTCWHQVGGTVGTADGRPVTEPLVGVDGAIAIKVTKDRSSGECDPFIEGTNTRDGRECALTVVDLGNHLISRGQGRGVTLSIGVGDGNRVGTGPLWTNGIG